MRRRLCGLSVWAGALALCGCGSDSGPLNADSVDSQARLSRVQTQPAEDTATTEQARQSGVLGVYRVDPQGGAVTTLNEEPDFSSGLDDRDVYGGLIGDEVGEMHGGWGYGVKGTGPGGGAINTENYTAYKVNPATETGDDKLSTFAIDVDTASYSIVRRKLLDEQTVPSSAVRVEEFVNYFRYGYEGPSDDRPFAVHMDAAPSPFDEGKHLLRVGVQAKKISKSERKPAHLVFLVDVSGSMSSEDKLGLVRQSLRILVDNLNDNDTVSMVTYAGRVEKLLDPTGLDKRSEIMAAIDSLESGGGTSMGSGVEVAYQLAAKQLSNDSISRVIVLSDGDANIGRTSHEEILKTVQGHVKEGVTLSTIGFGMGNYKDTMMEQLANKGNGNYFYVDSRKQAKRVFQEQLSGALEVVAKDVKIQVEFHEEAVKSYRLVGYENRDIADKDFRNDKIDAGEIGAGHTVTALYEVELVEDSWLPLATVRVRAKAPRGEKAKESIYLFDRDNLAPRFSAASKDLRFATAVMGAAEILRSSPRAKTWKMSTVLQLAKEATDGSAERKEFIALMRRADS